MPTTLPYTVVLGLALAATAAGAQAFERCEPFSVYLIEDSRKRAYIDHGDAGPSVGDRRINSAVVADESGEPIGRYDSEASAVHAGDAGEMRLSGRAQIQFEDGAITYETLAAPAARAFDDTGGGAAHTDTLRLITAGSGVFAGATGTITAVRGDDGDCLDVDVSCR